MAGIVSVYYADIDIINEFLPNGDGVKCTVHSGHTWSEIQGDSFEASSSYEAGQGYRQTVDITYHGNQTSVSRILDEMTKRRFILKCDDYNGTSWIYGTPDTPLRFTLSSVNDGDAAGETAFKLHFEALCPMPEMKMQ